MNRFYDNTMISSYKDCPRKYYLRHVKYWRGMGVAMPLAYGLAWHAALDVVWVMGRTCSKEETLNQAYAAFLTSWRDQGLPMQLTLEDIEKMTPRTPMIAREMIVGYIDRCWNMIRTCDLLAPEQPFAVPMPGLEGCYYIGRLDKVIDNGEVIALEHKSTTEYKKDGGFKTTYVEGWYSDSQVKGYEFGGALFFPRLAQVWVDAALVHKTVRAFRFIPVSHQLPLLEEWIRDTREWITRIEHDLGRNYFPKNESSCMGKFGPCSFLPICQTTPDKEVDVREAEDPPAGYLMEKWEPFDILHIDKILSRG